VGKHYNTRHTQKPRLSFRNAAAGLARRRGTAQRPGWPGGASLRRGIKEGRRGGRYGKSARRPDRGPAFSRAWRSGAGAARPRAARGRGPAATPPSRPTPPMRPHADWAGRRARVNRRAQGGASPGSKKLEEFSWAAHISPPLLTGAPYSSRQQSGRVPLVFPHRLVENRFVFGPTSGAT